MRLLLIEDNERLGRLVQRHLTGEGFATDVGKSIEEGWLALMGAAYDALILDLGLPDGDGLELLRKVRASNPNLPVLILTARDRLKTG